MSDVMLCAPQKSSISCVSAMPPIREPEIAFPPITIGAVFNIESRFPRNPTKTNVPVADKVGIQHFAIRSIFKGLQPHVWFGCISPVYYYLCCCFACNSPMQLVLNRFKEGLCCLCIFLIIYAALLLYISYFKVKTSLTCPYLPDTF